ncbi:MAG TPA: hypothetical protein VFC25_17775 [Verrucomicrobiae bacterium]|nr:hypothetical protein [Verrucomicrobiae bacterium]
MNVAGRLDPLPIGPFHRRLLLLSGLGWLFDSMDTGLVSFVGEETRGRTLEQIAA